MNFTKSENRIIYKDDDIIVAVKPAGIPILQDKLGTKSFQDYICGQIESMNQNSMTLECDSSISGVATLSAVNRLDRPVGGLVLFSLSARAKAWFAAADSCLEKNYQVIAQGQFPSASGGLINYLIHDEKKNISRVIPQKTGRAKRASLSYEVITEKQDKDKYLSLAEIQLQTGRHHQIRVQLSAIDCPVWGDRKYGKSQMAGETPHSPALFSSRLSFKLPGKHDEIKIFEANPFDWEPEIFGRFNHFD